MEIFNGDNNLENQQNLPKIIMTFVIILGLFTLFQLTKKPSWIVVAYIALMSVLAILNSFSFSGIERSKITNAKPNE